MNMVAVDDVDFSAAATLREVYNEFKRRGIRLVFSEVGDHIRAELDRSGITELIGPDAYYETVGAVLDAYRRQIKDA